MTFSETSANHIQESYLRPLIRHFGYYHVSISSRFYEPYPLALSPCLLDCDSFTRTHEKHIERFNNKLNCIAPMKNTHEHTFWYVQCQTQLYRTEELSQIIAHYSEHWRVFLECDTVRPSDAK